MKQQSIGQLARQIDRNVLEFLKGNDNYHLEIMMVHSGIATTITIDGPDVHEALELFLKTVQDLQAER